MKPKKIYIQIAVSESNYKLLAKYGFMFEKNINIYLNDLAEQLRAQERLNRKGKAEA